MQKALNPAPLRRRSSRQYTGQGSFCWKMLEPNLTKLNICPAGLLANVSIRTGEEQAKRLVKVRILTC